MVRLLVGLLAVASLVALAPAPSSAATFAWTVDCAEVVVGPVTVLAVNFAGSVDVVAGVPVTVGLLPTANLIRRDNPAALPGTYVGVLSCNLTFGGVTVPFTRTLTLVIGPSGNGDMTVGAVSISLSLGPGLETVTLSAPAFTSVGYDSTIPIIVVPLANNTTVVLGAPAIPTLSTWAMMALVAAMLAIGLVFVRRRGLRPA